MMDRLDCGHPLACLREDNDGNEYCAWCDHVEMIRVMAEAAGAAEERERTLIECLDAVYQTDTDHCYGHAKSGAEVKREIVTKLQAIREADDDAT